MTKAEAIAFFETEAALARACGIKAQSVQDWDEVPEVRQLQLHKVTGGKLAADPAIVEKFGLPIPTTERAA
jgi:hypothetical protein